MSLIVIEFATLSPLSHAVVVPVAFALPIIASVVRFLAVSVAAARAMVRIVFPLGRILGSVINLLAGIFENGSRVLHVDREMLMEEENRR